MISKHIQLNLELYVLSFEIPTFFLIQLSDFWLRKLLGIACIIFSFFQIWNEKQNKSSKPNVNNSKLSSSTCGVILGVIGGITSAMFHAGGLILSLFYLNRGLKKVPLVATIIFTWFWVNPFKVMNFWYHDLVNKEMIFIANLMFPISYLGSWIGRKPKRMRSHPPRPPMTVGSAARRATRSMPSRRADRP